MVTGLLSQEGWDKAGWYDLGQLSAHDPFSADGLTATYDNTVPLVMSSQMTVQGRSEVSRGDGSNIINPYLTQVLVEFIPDDDGVLTPVDDRTLDPSLKVDCRIALGFAPGYT